MFAQDYYFSITRKYVSLFGTLFNEINIIRTSTQGNTTSYTRVPITYSNKERMLARVQQDPGIDRDSATLTLPLMSFEMTGISYDGSRKLHTVGRSAVANLNNKDTLKYQYNPVPYNVGFRLYVYAKNAEDGTKIVEQILPYFTPDFTVTCILIPEMEIRMEIPIILNSIQQEDTYEDNWLNRRAIIWTLDFTIKGYYYGPIKTGKIIKFANTVYYTPHVPDGQLSTAVGNTDPVAFTHWQPGLTANGQPTSNASLSIDPHLIIATDDFGYVFEKVDPIPGE
jgi:T4-like virus Myoviridae tail sheath stabiliser